MSLALVLTLGRILMGPLFLLLYLCHESWGIGIGALPYLLITLVALTEISDLIDGFLARRLNQVTELGKLLDPMADSIFRLSVFLTFTQGLIGLPLLLVFVFVYRELIISTLRTVCALRGVALGARRSGKIKAIILVATILWILLLMIPYSLGKIDLFSLRLGSLLATALAALYSLFSGAEYIYANRRYIEKALH